MAKSGYEVDKLRSKLKAAEAKNPNSSESSTLRHRLGRYQKSLDSQKAAYQRSGVQEARHAAHSETAHVAAHNANPHHSASGGDEWNRDEAGKFTGGKS